MRSAFALVAVLGLFLLFDPPATGGTPLGTQASLTISMTNPTSGATVSGLITLSAKTSGGTAIREVRFYVDGNMVSSIDLVAPYAVSWDTTWVSNGAHI